MNAYETNIERQQIQLNGVVYDRKRILSTPLDLLASTPFEHDLFLFLKDWFSADNTLKVFTSGSTGTPKEISVQKKQMIQSALLTCRFLNLKQHDTALLCMPLKYIAGKMMVVRALTAGLNLFITEPDGHPLKNPNYKTAFDFVAMIPLQVYNSLQNKEERKKLEQIKNLIIGGGAIDPNMAQQLKPMPNAIYSTYGMTETLSHIALRQLNGNRNSDRYLPFDSVRLSTGEDNNLIIDAPQIASQPIETNDIVKLYPDGSFTITGRKDNIINSGGIKIQPEIIEQVIRPYLKGMYAISSKTDEKLGERLVLVVDENTIINNEYKKAIGNIYAVPKEEIRMKKIPQTETGKINRPKLKKQINN